MKLLDDYSNIVSDIHNYFGYFEDWRVLPLDDSRLYYWQLIGSESDGSVRFAETAEQLEDRDAGEYYENEIYTQRHLPKWIYRGEDYTMICVDTHVDGNKFLQIFTNKLEIK